MTSKRSTKRARPKDLEVAGARVTTAQEIAGLSGEEMALIELRANIMLAVRARRQAEGLTQAELAKRAGTTQSRIARIEAGDPHISLDAFVRALAATGATLKVA